MSDPDDDKLRRYTLAGLNRTVELKEMAVAGGGAEAPMPFLVQAYRGDAHIVTMFPHGRDKMLWAVGLAVGGFGCDIVAGTVDSWHTDAEVNPMTGKRWEAGEMQKAYDAGYHDIIKEGLSIHAVDKLTGKLAGATRAYRVKHRKVRWDPMFGPMIAGEEGFRAYGVVVDAFREALTRPDILALATRLAGTPNIFGLTPHQARAHTDVVCLRFCAKLEVPVAYNGQDAETLEIIETSLGDEERNAEYGVGISIRRLDPQTGDPQ